MAAPPLPDHEYARLLELARYDILDTAPEPAFDRLTRLAARALQVPLAAINFVDQDRQWGKSCFGIGDATAPREHSFCAWTILGEEVLVVPDVTCDPRFQGNPMVTGEPLIRMYAGAPLVTPRGYRVGTLCVADRVPRVLGPEDLATLQDLAALVVDELELRLRNRELEAQVDRQRRELDDLEQLVAHARVLEAVGELLDMPLTPQEATLAAAALIGEAIHADWTGLLALRGDDLQVRVAHHRPDLSAALLRVVERLPDLPGGLTRALGEVGKATYLEDYAGHPGALPEAVEAGVQAAAWVPLGSLDGTAFLLVAVRVRGEGSRNAWRNGDRALLDAAGRSIRAALERQAALQASGRAARQDPLTGVGNRRAFEEALESRMGAGEPFTLALIDLDSFKGINDTEGHAQGDQVLRVFAATLQGELGAAGQVYRYGGDEFVLLLRDLTQDEVLEHVDIAVLAARQVTTQAVGASVGVVVSTEGESGAALLHLADERMYVAKRRRRERRAASPTRP